MAKTSDRRAGSDRLGLLVVHLGGCCGGFANAPIEVVPVGSRRRCHPDTLRDVLTALTEAHAYNTHPASITPCATKRVATHRVPRHQFSAMDHQIRAALKTLDGLMRAEAT